MWLRLTYILHSLSLYTFSRVFFFSFFFFVAFYINVEKLLYYDVTALNSYELQLNVVFNVVL